MAQRCDCPLYCRYCGGKRKRDNVGHLCGTPNCQWKFGFSTCTLHEDRRTFAKTRTRTKP